MKNIKFVRVGFGNEHIDIVAVDKDNVIFSYIDGVEKIFEYNKTIRFIELFYWRDYLDDDKYELNENTTGNNIFIINESHSLINFNTKKTIAEDVVWLGKDYISEYDNQGFYVTMSGNIYKRFAVANENPEQTYGKTAVLNSWKGY